MIKVKIKRLSHKEINLAKQLILLFGFDDKNPALPGNEYVSQMLNRDDFHVIIALENGQLIGGLTA